MNISEAIIGRRTVRKFKQDEISRDTLEELVNAARFAPSASNMQPIKYALAYNKDVVGSIFENVRWAAYIAPEGNPAANEQPAAFIVILIDTDIRKNGYEHDVGAAAQNIFLAAYGKGIGTCWMGAINRDNIRRILGISEKYIIDTVIALGYAAEEPIAEEESGSIKYYKDENGILHVPKRKLKDIIV